MRPKFLLCPALLALLPSAALAQSAPRLYAGASAVLLRFAPFESLASTYVGPAATVGLQLSPRWALETGAQLTWNLHTSTYRPIDPSGNFTTSSARSSALLVPLLARYSVSQPTAPLHVDALGGVSWLHRSGQVGDNIPTLLSQGANNELGVVLGPQLRYSFGSAVEAKLNLPLNMILGAG